jgi:hypothetical protein
MKKITLLSSLRQAHLVALCFLLLTLVVKAQTPPNAFNYSAVARNVAGQPISNTAIGIQITILKTTPSGVSQYSENHFVNTDAFGLFNLVIGAGALQSGSMATIDWSNDNYYLKVGMDAAGGTNFLTMGTTQLLSVPYAMYAKSAGSLSSGANETDPVFGASVANGITGADTTNWNNKQNQLIAGSNITINGNTISAISGVSSNSYYLGQDTLGGIVFYIYIGSDGNQHGLIVSKIETTAQWQSTFSTTGATSMWDGFSNTSLLINSPAKDWIISNFTSEWYLPSINELHILFQNIYHLNKAISMGNLTNLPFGQSASNDYYWSSTEKIDEVQYTGDENNAYTFGIPQAYNYILGDSKSASRKVRAVRSF